VITIGDILKAHRTSRGLSLAKMAQALELHGVKRTRAMVHRYETQPIELRRAVLAAYVNALELEQSEAIELYKAAGFLVVAS
jgi:transcriptional regulator with XRE-family HTH domain|tara:strand:- start:470 stop:715 length:246 start_codon:yes stop_codon:yes gene_type:complete